MERFVFLYILFFNFFFAFLLIFISRKLASKFENNQKLSAYECGFDPFEDTKISFNIHYFLIAILFIIFDVEIVLMFPLIVNFSMHSLFSYIYILFFLIMLTLGFFLE